MAQQVTNSNLTMYTDDHQMYKTGPNLAMVKDSLKEQGKQSMSWYEENYLQAKSRQISDAHHRSEKREHKSTEPGYISEWTGCQE